MIAKTFNINRRDFLKGAFAYLLLSNFRVYGFDLMNPLKTYRVGLIGTAGMGKAIYFLF